ncbi:MAG: putative hydrolase YutF [Chloroflexi bacterium ADurb.Bin325]|nr:MAG: putative hydrolase YutF [Chloroflexi bacterium ADurb.Bin325]
MSAEMMLSDLRAFIFDMDGVIYRGAAVLPGAVEFVANLRRAAIPYLFVTNNSTTPPRAVAERLVGMGIDATPDEILTSADATALALAKERNGGRVLVIGEAGIREALTGAGFTLTESAREADMVVVGMDRQVNYMRLREAALAIQRGIPFVATNTDRTLPTEEGLVPGAGSLVGMLEIATSRKARAIGKPAPDIFLIALQRMAASAACTGAIGDRPETDILGGQAAGLRTIAVLTGAGTPEQFAAMQPGPDWVFTDLVELDRAYFHGLQIEN